MKKVAITFLIIIIGWELDAQWTSIATNVLTFDFSSEKVGYISNVARWIGSGGNDIYIKKTEDGGLTWGTVYSDYSYNMIVELYSRWEDTCYYQNASYCAWHQTVNGGGSWDYFTQLYCTTWDVCFYSSNAALTTTTQLDTNYIARLEYSIFEDILLKSDTIRFYKISLNDDGIGFVTCKHGNQNSILLIKPPYTEWSNLYTTNNSLNDIQFTGDSTGYAIGDSGLIIKTVNLGETWTPVDPEVDVNLNSIDYVDDDTVYCVGDSGTVLSTFDGGKTWSVDVIKRNSKLVSVRAFSNSILYVLSDEIQEENILFARKDPSFVEETKLTGSKTQIYPNPFNDFINISNLLNENCSIRITSVDGKVIHLQNVSNVNNWKIETSGWEQGTYIMSIATKSGSKHLKIIKN